ncbi:MAG: SUMF1/EgtB/PvdO family nonheme iron enzyme [Lachnospiraceae bacterium]|nr:SUMF1/EgtB/PvdO family nonheme iron enzyme [Lachnospiraceae bacterium]
MRFIPIPNGKYQISRNGRLYFHMFDNMEISETKITVDEFVNWFKTSRLENHVEGTYCFFNDVNTNTPYEFSKEANDYLIKENKHNTPMVGVNWIGAMKYAQAFGGRLPTELEWEICAKAGVSDCVFPWGNTKPDGTKCNYGNMIGACTQVYNYPPNAWGLYEMCGNVREWCLDRYHPEIAFSYEYSDQEISVPIRVVKGGSWDKTENYLACEHSEGKWERIGTVGIGFRVIRRRAL